MQTAKLFQVTPRTVQNWRSGATRPPGVVVHLLRIRSRWQVPCAGWDGWHFHSGKLWTPEGRAIGPQDGSWWSLLVRQARAFRTVYAQVQELRDLARRAWAAGYLEAPAEAERLERALGVAASAPAAGGAGLVSVSTTRTRVQRKAASSSPASLGCYQFDSCRSEQADITLITERNHHELPAQASA